MTTEIIEMLTTTFALLNAHDACRDRYEHLARALGGVGTYGKDTAIPLLTILNHNGLDDALWALRAVPEEQTAKRDKLSRLLACEYTEHILPRAWDTIYPEDRRPWNAIAVTRRYANGEASDEELAAARDLAWAARKVAWTAKGVAGAASEAAWEAAWAAAGEAARAARAAAWAAREATREAEREWQASRLRWYLAGTQ